MSERDEREELAQVICTIDGPATIGGRELAQGILDAGYRKPRTITTAEELDALPVGSVVLDADNVACQRMKLPELWESGGELITTKLIPLPATVLHEPAA